MGWSSKILIGLGFLNLKFGQFYGGVWSFNQGRMKVLALALVQRFVLLARVPTEEFDESLGPQIC